MLLCALGVDEPASIEGQDCQVWVCQEPGGLRSFLFLATSEVR